MSAKYSTNPNNPYKPGTFDWYEWNYEQWVREAKTGELIKSMIEAHAEKDSRCVNQIEEELNRRFAKLDGEGDDNGPHIREGEEVQG